MSDMTFNPVCFMIGYAIGAVFIYAIIWWKWRDGE
jgi:hypothetical protein